MNRPSKLVVAFIATFVIGVLAVVGWFYYGKTPSIEICLPSSSWEPIFFKEINRVTDLAKLKPLRKISVRKGDTEVRIWRGFGLSPLEGVILKRYGGIWSALHISADKYLEAENAEVTQLEPPRTGWDSFWVSIVDKGLLTLPDPSEIGCEESGIDGSGYVVEINQDGLYRTYMYSCFEHCKEATQMNEIGDIIGWEFDSGKERCERDEWFPCAMFRGGRTIK